jgi:nucleotide-binding universal stress UspA family protein
MVTFANIAVCVDDSDAAGLALDAARSIRPEGATLTLLHVVEPPSFLVELSALGGGIVRDKGPIEEAANAWLQSLAEPGERALVLEGSPAQTVIDWASQHDCDLLVMATARSSGERHILGGFSHRVTANAPCSTLLVHPDTSR